MGVCSVTSKCVLLIINVLFWVCAAFFVFAGVSYLSSNASVLDHVNSKPAAVILGAAGVLFLCGLIGIAAAFSEKKILLAIFSFVIVTTLCLLIFVTVSAFKSQDQAWNDTETFVHQQFNDYEDNSQKVMHFRSVRSVDLTSDAANDTTVAESTTVVATTTIPKTATTKPTTTPAPASNTTAAVSTTASISTAAPATTAASSTVAPVTTAAPDVDPVKFVDDIQKTLKCCGYVNYTDWNSYSNWDHKKYVPQSCCNTTATNGTCPKLIPMKKADWIYQKACGDEIKTVFDYVFDVMKYSGVALTILIFLGFCATMILLFRKRNDEFSYSSIVA